MTQKDVANALQQHQRWVQNQNNGKRADFRGASLRNVDFTGADLRYADFRGAVASYIKLSLRIVKGLISGVRISASLNVSARNFVTPDSRAQTSTALICRRRIWNMPK
jgi:uncharacterized protein YjbI with pentapeptide repeats